MVRIRKEYIIDEAGNPTKVIIPLADFRLLEEMLGLDLDAEALDDLLQARHDREENRKNAYLDLDDLE
jgi:hypothetical protein